MTPELRKFALTTHVTSSIGWIGAVIVLLALAVLDLASQEPQRPRRLESTPTPPCDHQPADLCFVSAAVTHVLPGDGETNVSPASMSELLRKLEPANGLEPSTC